MKKTLERPRLRRDNDAEDLGDKVRLGDGWFGERDNDVRLVLRRVLEAEQIRRKITSARYTPENTF